MHYFASSPGVIILATNRTLVEFLGLPSNANLTALGIGLLGYAAWLLWTARREKIKIVFAVRLSSGGKWAVGLVAEVVFLFGVMQWLGLRRIGRSRQPV